MYERPIDMDNEMGTDMEVGVGLVEGAKGEIIGTTVKLKGKKIF